MGSFCSHADYVAQVVHNSAQATFATTLLNSSRYYGAAGNRSIKETSKLKDYNKGILSRAR